MHLGNFVILVSFSTALTTKPERNYGVHEKRLKSFTPSPLFDQAANQETIVNEFSADDDIEKIDKKSHFSSSTSFSKYGSKTNSYEEEKKEGKKKRKMGKSVKEEIKDSEVSRLTDEIVNKIQKLLESEIKEVNKIPERRSNTETEAEESILLQTSSTLQSNDSTGIKEIQILQEPSKQTSEISSRNENQCSEKQNEKRDKEESQIELGNENQGSEKQNEKKDKEESQIEKKEISLETISDTKSKKRRPTESANDRKTQDGEINMTKLSRNGGIENNLSRKEFGKPSWRSELMGIKQQTQEVKSSESTVFLKISSSLQEPKINSTKPDQESDEVLPSKTHDPQILDDFGSGKQKRPVQNVHSRTKGEIVEPREEDLIEAANFGMQAMNDLYYIKEPKLYSLGLFLGPNNPARYVANFNDQTDEARHLAKFGFAALEGTKLFITKFPEISRESPFTRSSARTALHRQCPRRGIPQCPPASLRYRTADGSCNNAKNLWWGSAMSTMQRFLPPVYQDGIQSVRRSVNGNLLPSAREISNFIHEDRDIPLASVSHMLMQWGQFIDHDITATGQSRAFNGTVPQCCLDHGTGFQPPEFMHPECLPIAVHPRDSFFSHLGVRCLEFTRSGPAPRENCEFGPREQVFQVTSYLDASTVYSSNVVHSDSLRIFRDGLLQYGKLQSRRHLLVRDQSDICQLGSLSQSCFRAGDGRLGENPALTSLHVVFLRLHNRIATQISKLNPHWSEERMFQETRKIVGAIVQHITYREFLPIVLGHEVMKIFELEVLRKGYYNGYDPTINPNIANEFAAAAYRFGHSLVQKSFVRFDRNHRPLFNNVSIHEEFFNPHLQSAGSLDRIMLGLVNQPSQKRDEFISEELTNHLFQRPTFPFGMDLASLNIQRGRDHGIPPYAHYRTTCGLSPINNWEDLAKVMNPLTARKFRFLYSSVNDIDLFPAGLAEKPVVGGLVGPTFACIIAQQFSNLRKGDRFWFENALKENRFTPQQLQQIRSITLAQVLCKTMDNIDSLQPFVMLLPDEFKNRRIACNDPRIGNINVKAWAELPPEKINKTRGWGNEGFFQEDKNFAQARSSISDPESRQVGEDKQRPLRPQKAGIHQQNRIVLKRPIAPKENISIVVQNYAVNAPVFVRDSIYGSHVNFNPQPVSNQPSTKKPSTFLEEEEAQFQPTQKPFNLKPSRPQFDISNPYMPQNFEDLSNPNPPSYGFSSDPVNIYVPNNAFFENMYNNNYRPDGERPDFNQESDLKPIPETPEYNSDKIPQNSWTTKPASISVGYQVRPTSGTNQNFYNYKPPEQNPPNYNRPFSEQDNPNPPVQEGSQKPDPGNQNFPNYQRPVANKPTERPTSRPSPPSKRPTQNKPNRKPETLRPQYSDSDYSDLNYKNYDNVQVYSKPVTLPSIIIVSETLETVRFTEKVKTTPKRKHDGELPRPLIPQHRTIDDLPGERAEIAGPGLHYFNKNVLYKYPQKIENLTDNKDRLVNNSVVVDYTIKKATIDEIKFTTTPTVVLSDDSNQFPSIEKHLDEQKNSEEDGIEAVVVESLDYEIADSINKPEVSTSTEDSFANLTVFLEQPEWNFEFPTSEELPKPIKLRTTVS